MSNPVHKRGSAAEQGAAIRRQFEASQQKRFSSQMEKDRSYQRQEQAQSPSSYQQQPSGNGKAQRRNNNRTSRSGAPPPPPSQARQQPNRYDYEDNPMDEDERYGDNKNNSQQPRLAAHRDSIRRRRQIPSPPPSKAERSEAAEPRAASAAGRRQSTQQRRSVAGRGDEEYQDEDDDGEAIAAPSRRSGQQRRSMGGRKSGDQGAVSRRKSTQTRRPYEDEEGDMNGDAYAAPRRRSTQPRRADEDDTEMAPPSGRRSRQTRRSYAGRDDDEERGEDEDDDGQLDRKAALAGAAAAAPAASRRRSKREPEREDTSKPKRNRVEKRKPEKKSRQTRDTKEAPSRRRRRAEEEPEEANDGGEQERTDYGGEKTGIVGGFLAKRRAAKAEAARKDAEEKEAKEQEKKAEESKSRSYSKTEKAGVGALAGGGLAAMATGLFSRGKKQDKDKGPESDPEKQDAFTSDEAKSPDEPTGGRRRNYARREARALAAPSTVGGRTATDSEVDQRDDLGDVDEEDDLEQDDEDVEQEDASEGDVTESEDPRRSKSRRRNGASVGAAAVAAGGTGASAVSGSSSAGRSRGPRKLESKGRVYPLTGIDNVALLMEDQGYQTVCFSVYLFKTQLDVETVVAFFEKLADAYPKYRYVCELDPSKANKHDKAARKGQPNAPTDFDPGRKTTYSKSLKAGSLLSPAKWRIDEDFEVGDNISFVEAEPPGDDESLFNLCGQCLSEHFDFNRPLWQAVVVHGLQTSEGARSALMIKIHHAFSDGQGMIQSYHSAIEAMQQGVSISGKQAEIDAGAAAGGGGAKRTRRQSEKGGARREEEQKKIGSRNIRPTIGGTVSHTWHTVRGLYFRKRKAFTYPDSAGKEAARSYGAQLGKNGRPSTRFYAHSGGIAMDEIQLIRKAFSTPKMNLSLNDVACAILSRALRIAAEAQADRQGEKVKDKRIAIFIPVSKRPKGDWTLANYTTGAIAWFRFHEPSTYGFEQLLSQVHREMNRIKRSHLPTLWYKVFDMACKRRLMMAPNYPIARTIFQRAYREYHVATNVPSSTKPVSFGKHKAFRYNVLPPSSPGKATLAIGMVSYAGDFSLSVSCDGVRQNQEMSEIICEAFQQAGDELIDAAEEKMRSPRK